MWNVTSMVNKTPKMMEHMDYDPGIVFISETWLKFDSKEIGGGVGVLLKLGMKHKHLHVNGEIITQQREIMAICVYIPSVIYSCHNIS